MRTTAPCTIRVTPFGSAVIVNPLENTSNLMVSVQQVNTVHPQGFPGPSSYEPVGPMLFFHLRTTDRIRTEGGLTHVKYAIADLIFATITFKEGCLHNRFRLGFYLNNDKEHTLEEITER